MRRCRRSYRRRHRRSSDANKRTFGKCLREPVDLLHHVTDDALHPRRVDLETKSFSKMHVTSGRGGRGWVDTGERGANMGRVAF